MKYGYMRVSTDKQDHALQFDALIRSGIIAENIFQDTMSGKTTTREGLEKCLSSLHQGDTLVVWKLDRLGRDARHLYNVVGDLLDRKVVVKSLTGEFDLSTVQGRGMFGMQAVFAEMERGYICERVKAGIAAKMAGGRKRWGRLPNVDYDRDVVAHMLDMGMTHRAVAGHLGISKATVQRIYKLTAPQTSRNINQGVQ